MTRASRTPLRTCVTCRRVRAKHELVRLVRRVDGAVAVDIPGGASGRGAYVCAAMECVDGVAKVGRLARAFRRPCTVGTNLSEEVRGLWQRRR